MALDDDAASEALARRLQAEELGWSASGGGAPHRRGRNGSGDALLFGNVPPPPRQLLVANANQVVYDVRSSGRFIALAVLYGIIELVAGCVVLATTFSTPCDVPLKFWLIVFLLRYCIVFPQEFVRYIAHARRHDELMISVQNLDKLRSSFSFVWTIMGLLWTLGSSEASCRATSPVLWYFVATLIIMHIALACSPLILLAMFCMCLPCLLLLLRFFQPNEGMSSNDVRKLPERTFDSTGVDMTTAAGSCVICQTEFVNGDRLRHLPCNHEFHSACLDQWLVLKATCPLCRVHIGGLASRPDSPV
ncbi:RING-type domain-containing protein [Plasmodiophora brassicae]|uniref:RING-type domain-containing protein n=1 Tax=Plasmodiophora brassicae TaxID=37360 RepID=A0A3P3XZS9_PLABS|nr:unnamed protein product [Plasmodiophora brassicae]